MAKTFSGSRPKPSVHEIIIKSIWNSLLESAYQDKTYQSHPHLRITGPTHEEFNLPTPTHSRSHTRVSAMLNMHEGPEQGQCKLRAKWPFQQYLRELGAGLVDEQAKNNVCLVCLLSKMQAMQGARGNTLSGHWQLAARRYGLGRPLESLANEIAIKAAALFLFASECTRVQAWALSCNHTQHVLVN